ncbi:MAG: phage tail protein [Calditrichia bacterium]
MISPLQTLNFRIEIDQIQVATFIECHGLEIYRNYSFYYEGGNNEFAYTIPGPVYHPPIFLKKGIIHNIVFFDWFNMKSQDEQLRKNGSIILCKPNGEEAHRWNFFNALPVRWTGPSFNALRDELAIEAIELVHEGLILVKNS